MSASAAFTVSELTKVIPISRNTIYKQITAGEIPAVRIGSKLCIPRRWVIENFGPIDELEAAS